MGVFKKEVTEVQERQRLAIQELSSGLAEEGCQEWLLLYRQPNGSVNASSSVGPGQWGPLMDKLKMDMGLPTISAVTMEMQTALVREWRRGNDDYYNVVEVRLLSPEFHQGDKVKVIIQKEG